MFSDSAADGHESMVTLARSEAPTEARMIAYAVAVEVLVAACFRRTEVDALIVESANVEDLEALEFAIAYNRSNKTSEDLMFIGKTDSLLR